MSYKDDNCESCIHGKICALRSDYLKYVMEVRNNVNTKMNNFCISVTCNYFSKSTPTIK